MLGMPFKKLGRRIYLAQDLTHRLQKEHSGEEVGGGRGGKACGLALLAGERTGRARAHAAHAAHPPTHMGTTIVVRVREARLCSDDQTGNRPGKKVASDS